MHTCVSPEQLSVLSSIKLVLAFQSSLIIITSVEELLQSFCRGMNIQTSMCLMHVFVSP